MSIDVKETCTCGASFEYDSINDEITDMYQKFIIRHSECNHAVQWLNKIGFVNKKGKEYDEDN
jgi:hypothetical protein